MKKQYINPTLYVKGIRQNPILAGSPETTDENAQTNTDTQNGSGNGGDGLAKDNHWGLDWGE